MTRHQVDHHGNEDRQRRQAELRRIVQDAVEHVLERPDERRGPYIIDDSLLRDADRGGHVGEVTLR